MNIYYSETEQSERGLQNLMVKYDGVYDLRGLAKCVLDGISISPSRLRIFTSEEKMMARELQRIANENYSATKGQKS